MYEGPYQKDIVSDVQEVKDHLADLNAGAMVAVLLGNYSIDKPWIGEVLEMTDNEIKIHYWKGSYNKPWEPNMLRQRKGKSCQDEAYTDWLPKLCIYYCGFTLTQERKLTKWRKVHQRPGIRGKLKPIRNKRKIPEDGADLTVKTSETPEI